MPFYEYECSNCKFYTEVMQKISDAPLTKCPSCGKKALKKLVSAPNFRLKGGGWYETDFKGDKENKRNLAGVEKDESPSKSESSAASTSDPSAKPDAVKAEPAKAESGKSEAPKAESKSDGGLGSAAESKSRAGRRNSIGSGGAGPGKTGKPAVVAKPVSRTAASKARPALVRGKSKATSGGKKARK